MNTFMTRTHLTRETKKILFLPYSLLVPHSNLNHCNSIYQAS